MLLCLWNKCLCPLLVGEERGERRKVFPPDRISFYLPGNSRALQTSPTCITVASSSRYISSPRFQSALVFSFHRSSCSCLSWPVAQKKKKKNQNTHVKGKIHPFILLHCCVMLWTCLTGYFQYFQTGHDLIPANKRLGVWAAHKHQVAPLVCKF